MAKSVTEIIVDSLNNAGVKVVFGVPGAKIDSIFDCLQDHPEIRMIVARHEQNAAMMAAAVGRITGTPGVCIATSGPGASNLTTGLLTATTEGDPVVALIGSVPRLQSTKHTHQSMRALDVLGPTCKTATNIDVEDQAAEVILAAFRTAATSPKGATVISIPMDVAKGNSKILSFPPPAFIPPLYGPAPHDRIQEVARLIENAKLPVLYLGMRASSPKVVDTVRRLLKKLPIPTIETFQAAGALSKDLAHLFYGRVGLFRNQTGDKLLAKSDLVLCVGYDATEYDANAWNPSGDLKIVHIDYHSADYGFYYHPEHELLGSVVSNLTALTEEVKNVQDPAESSTCKQLSAEFQSWLERNDIKRSEGLVHPLHFISLLQENVSEDTTVTCDVGTVYM